MADIALKIEKLSKEYRLGKIGYGTLREDLQSWWARIRGQEDPNSLISYDHGKTESKNHFLALNDISFEIKKSDRIGIIGRNGAGKSTLLKILSKITSPSEGNIYINGRIGSLLEVGTGFHKELTGRENIFLNGSILGMKKNEIEKKLDEIVDFSGIEKFIDTPVKRYSSGMYVRLGFAVAAHLEPEILVVDEVLAVGDYEFQKKAIGKMEDVSKNDGRTILFVSHNLGSIESLCNKGVILDHGSLICPPDEIGKVISQYKGLINNSNVNERSDSINNKFFTLNNIYFDVEESNLLTMDKNSELIIDLNIAKDPSRIQLGISVFDSNDQELFRSYINDKDNCNELLIIGHNKVKVTIPKYFLNSGLYRVVFIAKILGESWLYTPRENVKYIDIGLEGGHFGPTDLWNRRRGGLLAPLLDWSVNNET